MREIIKSDNLGTILRLKREQQGLTREQLERISGVQANTIRSIELGYRTGSFPTIEKLFDSLHYEIEILEK